MTLLELRRRAEQAGITIEKRRVSIWGPTLRARMKVLPHLSLAEIFAHPDQTHELKTFRYGHLLEPGVAIDEIAAWRKRWPKHSLPADLGEMLLEVNGIHLWADLDRRRSYIGVGVAPMAEWVDAGTTWWADFLDPRPEASVVISYSVDGNGGIVLDTRSGAYRWFDWMDLDHPKIIGHSVDELLDWLWEENRRFGCRPMGNLT